MQIAMRDSDGNLFTDDPPRTRATDPVTSHLAEKHMRESGKLNEQQERVRLRVLMDPGLTAREYQADPMFPNSPEGMFRRRLCELVRKGLVRVGELRKCRVGGKLSQTYWPVNP